MDPLANHNPIVAARRWLEEHDRVALATVVSTWSHRGSASRAPSREAASKSM